MGGQKGEVEGEGASRAKLVERLEAALQGSDLEPADLRALLVLARASAERAPSAPGQAPVTADDIARSQIHAYRDDAEPVRSVNVRETDLTDAILAWAGDRYGFHDGPWEANLIIGGVHQLTINWEWEDEAEAEVNDELVGDEGSP